MNTLDIKRGWLIWSNEHEAWWAANSRGYTSSILSAGRYHFEEAKEICDSANSQVDSNTKPMEVMVPGPELQIAIAAHLAPEPAPDAHFEDAVEGDY